MSDHSAPEGLRAHPSWIDGEAESDRPKPSSLSIPPTHLSTTSLPLPDHPQTGGGSEFHADTASSNLTTPATEPTHSTILSSSRPGLDRAVSNLTASSSRYRNRANTTSHAVPSRTSRTSRLMRTASAALRPTISREWTVFGQRMENEGQLRTRETLNRRISRRSPRDHNPMISSASGASASTDMFPEIDDYLSPQEDDDAAGPSGSSSSAEEDSESELESDSDISRQNEQSESRRHHWFKIPSIPPIPPLYRNVLKCAVAYFIASLFTFSPFLAGFIANITSEGDKRPAPSGHMVATVAVYFNPAKTAGAMVEADIFCLFGVLWAAFVSLGSMTLYWFFEIRHGWEWLADVLAIFWIGVGMSCLAWMKLWMAKPSFNTACSMTSIILFVVVVKEGGLQTLLQVALIVLIGSLVSNVVCYVLWPQKATTNLQNNMEKTLDSFATLLKMVTRTFLLEETLTNQDRLQKAVDSHQASFTVLKKNLDEAHSERIWGGPAKLSGGKRQGREHLGQAYEDAVDSFNRLGQHLNGLRGGTSLQYQLAKAVRENRRENQSKGKVAHNGQAPSNDLEEKALLNAAAAMFGELVDDLGPPMKSLTNTCTVSLKELREAIVRRRPADGKPFQTENFHELNGSIRRALYTFDSTSNHALLRLYKRSEVAISTQSQDSDSRISSYGVGDESETLFLVYFFIFTLQEFAEELLNLVDAIGRIYTLERAAMMREWWLIRIIKKPFIYIRRRWHSNVSATLSRKPGRKSLRKPISAYFTPGPNSKQAWFPKVRPHAPNTVQTPARSELDFAGRVKQSLWALGSRMRENDFKYALKTGMATAILAAPAFFDATRPIFTEYRGEWALISFFVVMSPTIGATNNLSIHRVLGTIFGACTAAGIWTLFPENPIALSIFGFFYSIPCFYYIVSLPQYATTGRFVLLTYNLTCLFCYNLRQRDISVVTVAFHRSVAVTIGVLWAFFVSRFWWPSEARRELGKALGEFCLNLGWLYTRLVAHNSFAPVAEEVQSNDSEGDDDAHPNERTTLLKVNVEKLNNSITEFMAMELHLQIKLIEIQGLLAQTQHEPRLKGPFPIKLYRRILTSLQAILDKLHSMRCVTTKEEWYTSVRRDFIIPVNKERREMVGNIVLYFSTLSSAFRLKAPLPPYLPPAARAQQRLVQAIRDLDVVKRREIKGSRQLLFFAYALTMKGVIQELDLLGRTLQDAFGVIGQTTEEFEAMFHGTATGRDMV